MEPDTTTLHKAQDGIAPSLGPMVLSYEEAHRLAENLASAATAGGIPQVLVAVGRGGLVPTVIVSHRLGVRDVRAVAAEHTVDDGVNAAKTGRPGVAAGTLGDLTGRDVLIVDDVTGTGKTLAAVGDLVASAGARRIRSAVLVVNRANHPAGQAMPDYVGQQVDRWVVFPWERQEDPAGSGGECGGSR